MIFTQLKRVLKMGYPGRAQSEALVSLDFKLLSPKESLYLLCISPLANFALLLWVALLFLNPFRYQFTVIAKFPALAPLLYSPNWGLGISLGLILSYFLALESLAIGLVLYLVSQAEMHVALALFTLSGIFIGKILRTTKMVLKIEGRAKKVMANYLLVQLLAVGLGLYLNGNLYIAFDNAGLFSKSVFTGRFEFIVMALALFYFTSLLLSMIWGHFYARKKTDTSEVQFHFSTAKIFHKLSLKKPFVRELKGIVEQKRSGAAQNISNEDFKLVPRTIQHAAQKEKDYLDLAHSILEKY